MGRIRIKTPLPIKIILGLIIVVIGYFVAIALLRKTTIPVDITDIEQLHAVVNDNVLHYKSDITFNTTLPPSSIDYDRIFSDIVAKDTYIGSQVYSYNYRYISEGGKYNVRLKINHPMWHRTVLTKMRVKSIAKRVDSLGLSDYEKVKLVHDYLILLNEYSYSESGAFNGLYTGFTACNGYSYSFYAIMEELGIPVTCEFGGNHEWNRVMLDGEWYNIDLTWDDRGGKNVSYDYFLKCDADWKGHHHGGATAKTSIEPTGKSATENYGLIPNYMAITAVVALLITAVIFVLLVTAGKRVKNNKEKKMKPMEDFKVYSVDDTNIR